MIIYDIFDTDIDWYNHIRDWYLCAKAVELCSFVYKDNMRELATKKHLCKIGKVDTSICPKCNNETEDIIQV